MNQGEVRLYRVIWEVEAISVEGAEVTIGQVGEFIHLIEEATSRVDIPLGIVSSARSRY